MEEIVVALDWTPNTNHTGFYVAKAKGYYQAKGLKVRILGANEEDYRGSYSEGGDGESYATPCGKVAAKTATFALNSPEGIIGWNSPPPGMDRPGLKAVAAVLQTQTSAIVTLANSDIPRPAELDGKVYASYAARYESRIVQQMIKNDGGKGEFSEITPPMLGIWNTLVNGEAHATWVFLGWEGVEARLRGVKLRSFKMQDYGVPYGYAPVLCAHPDILRDSPDMVNDFLVATAKGFEFAAAYPEESADILITGAKTENNFELEEDLVHQSQKWLGSHYLTEQGQWGHMDSSRWDKYLDWLSDNGLLTTYVQSRNPKEGVSVSLDDLRNGNVGECIPRESFPSSKIFTNDYLPPASSELFTDLSSRVEECSRDMPSTCFCT